MSKKLLISILIIFVIALAGSSAVRFLGNGSVKVDVWTCQNGEWVKIGNPSMPKPEGLCEGDKPKEPKTPDKSDLIRVDFPQLGSEITSPVAVTGQARGNWFFEASFPIKIFNERGDLLNTGIAQAHPPAGGDWMTEDFVPFKAEIEFNNPEKGKGSLVLIKDNPSGDPKFDDQFVIPIVFGKGEELISIKVYFNNSNLDPEFSCNKVFPAERKIAKTQSVARAAIEELLKGVRESEKDSGFTTSINSGVKINSLVISNGTAKIDFDEQLEFQVGGSCRVSAIRAQITETLKQFESVDKVVISVNGRTEDILQP